MCFTVKKARQGGGMCVCVFVLLVSSVAKGHVSSI